MIPNVDGEIYAKFSFWNSVSPMSFFVSQGFGLADSLMFFITNENYNFTYTIMHVGLDGELGNRLMKW